MSSIKGDDDGWARALDGKGTKALVSVKSGEKSDEWSGIHNLDWCQGVVPFDYLCLSCIA